MSGRTRARRLQRAMGLTYQQGLDFLHKHGKTSYDRYIEDKESENRELVWHDAELAKEMNIKPKRRRQ